MTMREQIKIVMHGIETTEEMIDFIEHEVTNYSFYFTKVPTGYAYYGWLLDRVDNAYRIYNAIIEGKAAH